jgi:hypothetical protein
VEHWNVVTPRRKLSAADNGLNVSRSATMCAAGTMTSPLSSSVAVATDPRSPATCSECDGHQRRASATRRRSSHELQALAAGTPRRPPVATCDAFTAISPVPAEERAALCLPSASAAIVVTTLLRHLLLLAMQDDRVVADKGAAAALPQRIELGGPDVSRLLDAVVAAIVQLKRRVVAATADASRHLEAAAMRIASPAVATGAASLLSKRPTTEVLPAKSVSQLANRAESKVPCMPSLASLSAGAITPVAGGGSSFDLRQPHTAERQLLSGSFLQAQGPLLVEAAAVSSAQTRTAAVQPLSLQDLQTSPNGKSLRSADGGGPNSLSTLCGDKEMSEYEQWRKDFSRRVFSTE